MTEIELMFEKIFIFTYESSKMQTRNFVSGCTEETEVHTMKNYKKMIMEMLEKADESKLRMIYYYIKALLRL